MAKKPIQKAQTPEPTTDNGPFETVGHIEGVTPEWVDSVPEVIVFPDKTLLAQVRAKTREFSVFEAQYPSIAKAAAHIGPALGLGPINTAEAILLWQHWIGHE